MRIYFDVSTLNPQKVTGVGVYMLQLLRCFVNQNGVELIPSVKLSRIKNKKNIETLLPQKTCKVLSPVKFFAEPGALYHGPDFKMNVCGRIPRVVTIHDMVVFEEKYNHPEFYKKGIGEMTKVLSSSSLDAVIVNSQFTKSQVLRFFPHLQDRIYVTYLGCNRTTAVSNPFTLELPEKYILFLGTLEKRKNVLGLIKAFEVLRSQGFQEKLVLAGAWGFGSEEIQKVLASSPAKDHILHLNYVPDESLSELYHRAQLFFFPSWYEGFGIPVLEAMTLGCPVVTSSGGALQEVCGDAALFADPANIQEMVETLKKVLSEKTLRESLQEKGLVRARKFTWEQCAQDTLHVYKKVLKI